MKPIEEARLIREALQFNEMPDKARSWLRKRYVVLLLSSIGRFPQ